MIATTGKRKYKNKGQKRKFSNKQQVQMRWAEGMEKSRHSEFDGGETWERTYGVGFNLLKNETYL